MNSRFTSTVSRTGASIGSNKFRLVGLFEGRHTGRPRKLSDEERRELGGVFRSIVPKMDLANRLVAAACDVVEPSASMNFLHRHLILPQRTCLVRADDGGAAERLDRGQLADDRVMVTAAGNPWGMAPTANAIAAMNISGHGVPRRMQEMKINTARLRITYSSSRLNCAILRVNGVCNSSAKLHHPGNAAHLGCIAGGEDHAFALAGADYRAGQSQIGAVDKNRLSW